MAAFDAFQEQSRLSFRPRPGTLIRNEKNRLIVFNVLLRKAAERGGVHPVYIDDLSSRFAISIEAASSVSQLKTFPEKMIQDYCALIARQSIKNKHPLIQRCLLYIRQHCQEPLSLEDLAPRPFCFKAVSFHIIPQRNRPEPDQLYSPVPYRKSVRAFKNHWQSNPGNFFAVRFSKHILFLCIIQEILRADPQRISKAGHGTEKIRIPLIKHPIRPECFIRGRVLYSIGGHF